jgi:patatin-related protein
MKQTTDVRLALVMNGGVSLAVWMGGITHELDLLRRASESVKLGVGDGQDDPWAPAGADLPVFEAWKQLCRALNVQVTIDVVAGASAGGLNGTLLATSIANGGPLPNLREKWSALASLEPGKLLRGAPAGTYASILDGEYFASRAFELVSDISTHPDRAREMSLFVTATVAGPADQQLADSSGNRFSVPDHRRLYRFRRRTIWRYDPDEKAVKQFAPGVRGGMDEFAAVDDLSLAARASAGFPVAFEPKRETPALSRLRHTGVGARPMPDDRQPWLIDGGVLDNAPFGPVLEEIAQQNVDSPWRRVIAYVVPSGSAPLPPTASADQPPPWTAAFGAALRFPAEADLRGDLDQIGELMRRAARWVQTPDDLFAAMIPLKTNDADAVDAAVDTLRRAGITLADQYRHARIRAGVLDALTLWRSGEPARRLAVQTASPIAPVGDEPWVPPMPGPGGT